MNHAGAGPHVGVSTWDAADTRPLVWMKIRAPCTATPSSSPSRVRMGADPCTEGMQRGAPCRPERTRCKSQSGRGHPGGGQLPRSHPASPRYVAAQLHGGCTVPIFHPLCAGALWPMPAWVWRNVRSVFFPCSRLGAHSGICMGALTHLPVPHHDQWVWHDARLSPSLPSA